MILRFTLPFRTAWGQRLVVCGSLPGLGQWDPTQALSLHYNADSGLWSQEISLPAGELATVAYKYLLLDERDGGRYWEWGPNRHVPAAAGSFTQLVLTDFWRAPALPENELYTAAFTEALLRRPAPMAAPAPAVAGPAVRFQLSAPRVEPLHQLCVLGSDAALGAWDATKAVVLSDADYPTWAAEVTLATPETDTRYKYGIWDPAARQLVELETGDDRVIPADSQARTLRVLADEDFRYAAAPWRGAGVALPVFALRSHQGLGVGEFPDLKLLDRLGRANRPASWCRCCPSTTPWPPTPGSIATPTPPFRCLPCTRSTLTSKALPRSRTRRPPRSWPACARS